MVERVLDRLQPDLLLKCYSKITKPEKIHEHFNKMKFENKEDRILIYQIYVSMMLSRSMQEKGYQGLSDWKGVISRKFETTGGRCDYSPKIIQIADWMIRHDLTKFEDLRETILHEIAHANTWLKHKVTGHGPVWTHEAKLIGCKADRCMPIKYAVSGVETVIYKCKNDVDKCIYVKTGTKRALSMFSKKMPTFICKKHQSEFDFIEIKPFDLEAHEKLKKLEEFKKRQGLSFGNKKDEIIVVEDGDVIEVDEDGEVYYVEQDVCLKYD